MSNNTVFIIFPHQLFEDITPLRLVDEVYLMEEYLFFNQYTFHKTKLVFHRASMKAYARKLEEAGLVCHCIESMQKESDIRNLIHFLKDFNTTLIHYYDVCDDWLEKRLRSASKTSKIELKEWVTPLFLNSKEDLKTYFEGKKKYFQTDFYIQQRKKWNILLDENQKPLGGQWSFDADNRLKYPKGKKAPIVQFPKKTTNYLSAINYVQQHYPHNPGNISETFIYPTTHDEAKLWLNDFLEHRLHEFGVYEDAIVEEASILHHSVLSPLMNIGLLLPKQVVDAAISYAANHHVPLNSLEGFIRQIIGWREFIRGVYLYKGVEERNRNFWEFTRPMPSCFYAGTTGIRPLDSTIQKVLETGYCHHIERLMLLGNSMLLLEINPDAVYQWFMEMFIDAYDWVMVPNIYGMSQFADGGLMATKPYISGSAYVLRMSNYKKGDWCAEWDALFWEFMNNHRNFFASNPRLGMLLRTYDHMSDEKKKALKSKREEIYSNYK